MTVLAERNLRLVLPANATGRKFDISATHKLLHCMKAVDFIIEYSAYTCFVEFKDPEAPAQRQRIQQSISGNLKRANSIKL